ncbi:MULTISPECIES: SagB/ThcOx family dehydrogenase [unclassified Bradyrhizobium]|uniref:SagB/ThcOx family dehydrogenase n=1 Tax=unclassified Bradyrhizobium TaxID=2631580 RepID=UPI0024784D09|nr:MULTISPECIES: SagB/ThcOx family dehydrogenase [unclassified Bradyrhizobium]WGR72932.1 SagB/ThcOx family dehydrogenase [Bradyrhizobium sp. ISRA426]WGR77767.1 SagB/ThcOx family dehydrogenase [Bradyrhizobium sp. ISRA430]WGR88172.1 SagB/ThcOx family dehydrogenase [Bradyrhizobium sp. ISRA432]
MFREVPVRRSRALLLNFEADGIAGYDFLSRMSGHLHPTSIAILSAFSDWRPLSSCVSELSHKVGSYSVVAREVIRLLDYGFLIVAGTSLGDRNEKYDREWAWGPIAGLYHFSIKYTQYLDASSSIAVMAERVRTLPQISLFKTNAGDARVVSLPPPRDDGCFAVMKRRRSYRGFDGRPEAAITKEQLRDCLFSGLGIVGLAMTDIGELPLKMTPSGGARNPYEAYVFAYNVRNLPRGVYHYSALENSLAPTPLDKLPLVEAVLGGQVWFSGAAALILLVANFARTAWKYRHPTGFRVVLIEAGHIAQNMLLAATANDLAAAPTCALDDAVIEDALDIDPVMESAIYAVAIGTRSEASTIADLVDWSVVEH